MGTSRDADAYLRAIERFVKEHRDPRIFEEEYLEAHRNDRVQQQDEISAVVEELFYDVDEYWDELGTEHAEGHLNDEQILQRATRALDELRAAIAVVTRREQGGAGRRDTTGPPDGGGAAT